MAAREKLTVGETEAGQRLDRFLVLRMPDLSRSRLQALIRAGEVTLKGAPVAGLGGKVKLGDTYEVHVPPPIAADPEPETIPLQIVFEDRHLIVIDKPKGMPAHPGAGHASGTLVNALLAHCGDSLSGIGGVKRPGIVHRLDKDTTGLLVVAKTDAAHQALAAQFAAHGADGKLERGYRAIVWGAPGRPRGSVDAPLGRSSANRLKMAVVASERGRRAVTHYAVLETFPKGAAKPLASLLRLTLETGRTHQVRVHMAHIGHPLLGDMVYGSGFKSSARNLTPEAEAALAVLDRQALHAAELKFEHPVTGKRLVFESELPQDMADVVAALRAIRPR